MGFLSGLVGGGKKTTKVKTTETPWEPQAEELEYIFDEARNLYDQGGYDGDMYAGLTPEQTNTINNSMELYGGLTDTGNQMLGQYQKAVDMALQPVEQVTNADINQFYNSDLVNQQIAANNNLISRDLQENQLTGNNLAAGATGNVGSSRKAIMDGIAIRGADDRAASSAAQIQNNAYNQAVGLAQNNVTQRNNRTEFGANMLQNQGNVAAGMMQQGIAGQLQLGNMLQQNNQVDLNNNFAQYESPWNNLSRFHSLVGDKSWGGTSEGNTTQKGGGNLLGGLGSLMQGFGAMNLKFGG